MITISRVDFDPKYLKREEEEENEPVFIQEKQPLEMMMKLNQQEIKKIKKMKSLKPDQLNKLQKMPTIKEDK